MGGKTEYQAFADSCGKPTLTHGRAFFKSTEEILKEHAAY